MKEKFSIIYTDNLIKLSISLSLAFSFIGIILTLFFYSKFPPFIPFFNSMPWGEERLAPKAAIFILFLIFMVVILFNNLLGLIFYNRNPLISRLLSVTACLFVILGFLASLQILFLVF